MKSQLVIGCRSCFEDIKESVGYCINNKGILRLPFPSHTAYTVDDLYELFFEHYTCPYCGEQLNFTPAMMAFANDYIQKKYHIVLQPGKVTIINDDGTYIFQSNENFDSFIGAGKDVFPNIEDMKEIFNVANDIDLSKWIFRIESGYTEKPFIQQVKPTKFKESEG